MTWKDRRLATIDEQAGQYRRELSGLVRAVVDVRVSDPARGITAIKKGSLVPRAYVAVSRRPDAFEPLDARIVENRVRSWVLRQRSAWNVG